MSAQYVVGIFSYIDTTKQALELLKSRGHRDYRLHMPTYIEELAETADDRVSPVRFITFAGGLTGLICGIAMTGWMSADWPIRTSMKPVLSWPAYTIIMFELTILLGGLANLLAMFGFTRLLRLKPEPGFDPRFTDDKFGIVVPARDDNLEELKALLEEAEAEEINDVVA